MNSIELQMESQNPRTHFIQAIRDNNAALCLHKTAEIHGHFCPGIALGVMASLYGLKHSEIGCFDADGFEGLIAIVEINACFADGIQAVTGCTFGNNSMIYRDLGKHAVTLALRKKKTGVRVRVRPDFQNLIAEVNPEFFPLFDKVVVKREYSAAEEARYKTKAKETTFAMIRRPFEEFLVADVVQPDLPGYAPITKISTCSCCGEQVMSSKAVMEKEAVLCYSCAAKDTYQVEGKGISIGNYVSPQYGKG